MSKKILENITDKFKELFDISPQIMARAPGRANIIGEHTDYNGGFVLPVGIDKNIYTLLSKREDENVHIYSYDFKEFSNFPLNQIEYDKKYRWVNYHKGILKELENFGYKIGGFNIVFGGDISVGAGLSSSAALELSTLIALKHLFNLNIDDFEMVQICLSAENNFVGVQCGIMDQFTSLKAKKDYAIILNCKSLVYKYVPLELDDYIIVLCNTNKKRELVESEYNRRRKECEEGVKIFKNIDPEIECLSDVNITLFEKEKHNLPKNVRKRCTHVIYENGRTIECFKTLMNNNLEKVGDLLLQSHYSLKNLYEVSCKELDILVEIAKNVKGCLGSRMMGAGFGGCTINLVKKQALQKFKNRIKSEYFKNTGIETDIYVCNIEDGAEVI